MAGADADGWVEAVAADVTAGDGVLPAVSGAPDEAEAEGLSTAPGEDGRVASPQATTMAEAAEAARKQRRDIPAPSKGPHDLDGPACGGVT